MSRSYTGSYNQEPGDGGTWSLVNQETGEGEPGPSRFDNVHFALFLYTIIIIHIQSKIYSFSSNI